MPCLFFILCLNIMFLCFCDFLKMDSFSEVFFLSLSCQVDLHGSISLPLGAATGPTAQGLLCAEPGEKNRTLHNTGGGAAPLWLGTQVFVRDS